MDPMAPTRPLGRKPGSGQPATTVAEHLRAYWIGRDDLVGRGAAEAAARRSGDGAGRRGAQDRAATRSGCTTATAGRITTGLSSAMWGYVATMAAPRDGDEQGGGHESPAAGRSLDRRQQAQDRGRRT